jgi:hypothetical protein
MTRARVGAGSSEVRPLQAFLADRRVDVIDVARGAARGTRRLVVGDKRTGRASHVVSVAVAPDAGARVEAEGRHLEELGRLVRPALTTSLPTVVARVEVSGRPGLVLSAVPGVGPRDTRTPAAMVDETTRVLTWLSMIWSDTSSEASPVDLGSQAYDVLLARFAGSRRAASTLGALQRSRAALADRNTARTVSHGCLCPRHVRVGDGDAIGADDWGRARFDADPLRDLGSWVVRAAGDGIEGVFTGRTGYARSLRDFVASGLAIWGVPSRLWREVVVLALAEAAVEGLEEQDVTAMDRLRAVSHGLAPTTTTRGRRRQ